MKDDVRFWSTGFKRQTVEMTQLLKDTISELTSIYASGRVTINCLDQIVSALVILITIVVKAIAFVEQRMPNPVFLPLFENPHEIFFKKFCKRNSPAPVWISQCIVQIVGIYIFPEFNLSIWATIMKIHPPWTIISNLLFSRIESVISQIMQVPINNYSLLNKFLFFLRTISSISSLINWE